jgi:redox-sensitive bicupin YhaK (pirin superfamily)
MASSPILGVHPLGFQWTTIDPFLFCVHHRDAYPRGNGALGPASSLLGRDLGQDFSGKDGWSMYHGTRVPGFPEHPHRGFETVTVVLRGTVDHSDSHGAAGRYADGDVQWMTAGNGLQHAEMFPLLSTNEDNPLELFQIWLNLPRARKLVQPYFRMLWREKIPVVEVGNGGVRVRVIAGMVEGVAAPPPAPDSWAADVESDVAIWLIDMNADGIWSIPPASPQARRGLYYYEGEGLTVGEEAVPPRHALELQADAPTELRTHDSSSRLLLLQAVPIGEAVVQYGPFVMNSREEIQEAFIDYQRTRFGGWPWPSPDHAHGPDQGRFARYPDGSVETPGSP